MTARLFEHLSQGLRSLLLHSIGHMAILRSCKGWVIMTKNLLNGVDGFTILQQHSSNGMPKVMKTNFFNAAALQFTLKTAC